MEKLTQKLPIYEVSVLQKLLNRLRFCLGAPAWAPTTMYWIRIHANKTDRVAFGGYTASRYNCRNILLLFSDRSWLRLLLRVVMHICLLVNCWLPFSSAVELMKGLITAD